MRENILPEERLLRLIRGHKKKDTLATPGPARLPLFKKFPLKFSPAAVLQKFRSPPSTQRVILAAFAAACLYLIISLIYPLWGLRKVKLPEVKPEAILVPKDSAKEEVKPFEFYQKDIGQREIFSGQAQGGLAQKAESALNAEAIKEINLVGIISGDNPQAVIEDKKTQKSYYLSVGQSIGEFQIEKILEGKIILNCRGQRYELYL